MSIMDFNDAEPQREGGGLIPEGTISLAVMTLRSGGHGEGGYLARSKSSNNEMLDVEFTLLGGAYERRKVWKYMSFSENGAPITHSQLRAALESAFDVDPKDMTDAARAKRAVSSYGDFDGLTVCIKVGIEKGKGEFADKNTLRAFVTPDMTGYIKPDGNVAGFVKAGTAVNAAVAQVAAKASANGAAPWSQ